MQASGIEKYDDTALWVALSQIKGLGNATLCQLLNKYGLPEAIFSTPASKLKEVVSAPIANAIAGGPNFESLAPTLTWLKDSENHIITFADHTYPQQLLEIANPPAILYAKGNISLLQKTCIAMVGSRNATPQGEKNAESFAENLCDHGICVVSGMALGIDGAAHRGAIKSTGETIAVVGTGLDIVYPATHRNLAHQIVQHGLILSEFALGTPSKAQNFPRRNRIISGLSLGCLVVEANLGSGSLITAKLAAEQGREVFAIPGSIHSPVVKGCHSLIKQGAKLVESSEDVLSELPIQTPENTGKNISPNGSLPKWANDSPEANTVLGFMGVDPIDFDALQQQTGLTADALSTMLTLLELDGVISKLDGLKFQRLI